MLLSLTSQELAVPMSTLTAAVRGTGFLAFSIWRVSREAPPAGVSGRSMNAWAASTARIV